MKAQGKGRLRRLDRIGIAIALVYVLGIISTSIYSRWQLTQPQYLPIEAEITTPSGSVLELELADTAFEKERGLQYRPPLLANQGMLFVVDTPKRITFWMAGVNQPLDVVMLRNGMVIDVLENLPPCRLSNFSRCPTYTTELEVDQIIEISAFQAERLGFRRGLSVLFTDLNQ